MLVIQRLFTLLVLAFVIALLLWDFDGRDIPGTKRISPPSPKYPEYREEIR